LLIEREVTNDDILSGKVNVGLQAGKKVGGGDSENNCAFKYCVGCVESFDVAGLGKVNCMSCTVEL